jgi:peptidoglycan biosynthesis protein MviN/MurJ (putative lipid II flippase)
VLAVYLVGAFPFAASTIVMRSFYAEQKMVFPMAVSTVIACISIPCYFFFSKAFGAMGIALASSTTMSLQFVVLFWTWEKRHHHLPDLFRTARLIATTIAIAAAGFCVSTALRTAIAPVFPHPTMVHQLLTAAGAGTPALLLCAAGLHLFRIMDLRELLGKRLRARFTK